uniref:Salivary glue protein Sgs-7 n=1 Tax=Drosophila melanogaster TaxID=7227 RepID=SGS7_DROME|nr:salivary gland secretion 7 [Drosophila melanogaster]P02841.1 RecName: Full=Salivary glue protein Sgs-7; Flags: Precursor [Drosophila melanogaster]AAF50058.1 salivary gland secretion 7 [Drosophila melanogaster]CAA25993.1 salivary gland glue protein [Drosophila melanogaster]|eukprot:NP_476718.1 salivary gland secretion 7 [Drosophila melanogaster]
MKLIAVTIIACILLIGFSDLALGGACECQPCGPGGKACTGCPEKPQLCQQLISDIRNLQQKIRKCVCGEPQWMI